jgi:holo-[acyl-carrier protein] synthase
VILGVGVDLAAVARMGAAIARHDGRFEAKVFTDAERAYCRARAAPALHYAARFAAKEAAVKACAPLRGQDWHSVEVVAAADGAPRLVLHDAALTAAQAIGVKRLHLSLSHDGGTAVALVVAEG